jgi:hypothetical protein
MAITVQEHMAQLTSKAAADLKAAFLRLPEDKRSWSPAETARTALDMMAECAMLNGSTADLIRTRQWPSGDEVMKAFFATKAELARSWSEAEARLDATLPVVLAAIRGLSDADLDVEVPMPWGPMTVMQIIAYPQWNMSYHEGQINYIASILGCLG